MRSPRATAIQIFTSSWLMLRAMCSTASTLTCLSRSMPATSRPTTPCTTPSPAASSTSSPSPAASTRSIRPSKRAAISTFCSPHGLFQERFSALLTDAIRAAVLEDEGYDVDVIEFIDFAHSPKNLMILYLRTGHRGTKKLTESRRLRDQYGFEQTLLSLVENERQ